MRCLILLLAGGVGIGAQGEPCVVVAQHGGHRLDVHAVLEGQGGEGMTEIGDPAHQTLVVPPDGRR